MLKRKQKKMTWICNVCHSDLHDKASGPSIICESYHFSCVGVTKQPKVKNWFCHWCYAASKSSQDLVLLLPQYCVHTYYYCVIIIAVI